MLSAIGAWLGTYLLTPLVEWMLSIGISDLITYLKNWWASRQSAAAEKTAADTYQNIVNNPNATEEDRKNAENNFLNS